MFQKKSHKCDVFPQFGYFLGSKSFTCWGSGDTPKLIISLQKWILLHRIKYDYTSSIEQIVQFIICIFEQKFKWQILTTFNLLVTPLFITKRTLQCAKGICIGNIVFTSLYDWWLHPLWLTHETSFSKPSTISSPSTNSNQSTNSNLSTTSITCTKSKSSTNNS